MTLTMTDEQAAEAIRGHHTEMAVTLRRLVGMLETAVRTQQPHGEPQRAVLDYLEDELLPHAAAEEQTLYPAGDRGLTGLLVRSMRDEHVNLVAQVEAFGRSGDAVEAVARSSAILALFEAHLHKENDLLVPALLTDPTVSLAALLGDMHELVG